MTSDELYSDYEKWKNWDERSFYKISESEALYLEREMQGYDLQGKNVLEIGFGNATKLAWLSSRGANVYGTEVNEKLCLRAVSAGIKVLPKEFSSLKLQYNQEFDYVLAYDVLEHLTMDQVREALCSISAILRPNGIFVARFPNGRSPLGRTHQYADHTHRSVLSDTIIEQIAGTFSLKLVKKSSGDYLHAPRNLKQFKTIPKTIIRKMLNLIVQKLYNIDTPIGSNLVLFLQKVD